MPVMQVEGVNLTSVSGSPLIGMLLGTVLYGITFAQVIFYLTNYPKDRVSLKVLVMFIWILDSVREILVTQVSYYELVLHHSDLAAQLQFPRTYAVYNAFSAITSFIAQCFYIHVIFKLLTVKHYRSLLTVTGAVLALLSLVTGVVFLGRSSGHQIVKDYVDAPTAIPAIITCISNVILDIYIATALCHIFCNARITHHQSTQTILEKLYMYAMNRGILLCVVQIVEFALLIKDHVSHTDYVSVIYFPFASLYINTVLASLNARHHLNELDATQAFELSTRISFVPEESTAPHTVGCSAMPHWD